MMLDERDKALIEEDIKRQAERQKVKKYSDEIRRQLLEKESMKQKEVDRIEEEALVLLNIIYYFIHLSLLSK